MLVVLVLAALPARAEPLVPPPLPLPRPDAVVTSCWLEPRWFETLRSGPLDYCRKHLRFRPGKLDCYAFTDEICWAYVADSREWTQLRGGGSPQLFVCPEGPEPPVCPRLR